MRGAEVYFLRLQRGRTMACAVMRSAQNRAALDDAAWRLGAGQRQIPQFWSARIDRCLPRVTRPIPVARPLPDIADHVVEAVTVRLEAADRRGPGVAVLVGVVDGEDALPGIGDRLALAIQRARPGGLAGSTPARRQVPFRRGREHAHHPPPI